MKTRLARLFAVAGAAVLLWQGTSLAIFIDGPDEDFRGTVSEATNGIRRSTGGHGGKCYDVKDNVSITVDLGAPAANLRGVLYLSADTPEQVGNLRITTIYGLDPNPLAAPLAIAGFNPAAPEVASVLDERMVGLSGVEYHADFAATPTLAELPALLPGFDLSAFQGAPSSFFYVFQTTVPSSDLGQFPVPEPTAAALLATASMGLGALRRRHRDD